MKTFLLAVLFIGAATVLFSQTYRITPTQGGKTLGIIEFQLLPEIAPIHAAFVAARIAEGFYNGSAFHRVIPGFMIQGGDPNSISGPKSTWGYGGYSESVNAEFGTTKHVRGTMSAARTNDPNSFQGQFFICVASTPWLDGQYSIFGQVTTGLEVVDQIVNMPRDVNDNPINKVSMTIEDAPWGVADDRMNQPISVYPQPAHSSLVVTLASTSAITIFDLNGSVVRTEHLDGGVRTIDVSEFACGAYVLAVDTDGHTSYQPIVIAAP